MVFFQNKFNVGEKSGIVTIYVCENVKTALLGRPALQTFNLVEINIPQNMSCSSVQEKEKDVIIQEFPSVFEGLGRIKGKPVHIETVENVIPYHIGAPRRVAIPLYLFIYLFSLIIQI